MRQRAECAMGRGMRVTTDDGHAGQGSALLRPDHMHDALALVLHIEIREAVRLGILIQRLDLQAGDGVLDATGTMRGGYVVISHHQIRSIAPRLAVRKLQALESLWAGDLVYQMAVDIENGGTVLRGVNHVGFPEFVVQGFGHRKVVQKWAWKQTE